MDNDATRLSLHHVGARSGNRIFPDAPSSFEKDFVTVLYDADTDCLDQIHENNVGRKSEVRVLPHCLSGTSGVQTFNMNFDPNSNSLLRFNDAYSSFYVRKGWDYVLGESFGMMEERQVECVTLDDLLAQDSTIPPPDFLSLDTQGAESDILRGGARTLRSNVLALEVEVEFHQLYEGQPLFGEVVRHLAEQGFYFAKICDSNALAEVSPFRAPIGLRGEGFHAYADALFLRRIDDLTNRDANASYLALSKLAFISIMIHQTEYALACLDQREKLTPTSELIAELGHATWFQFINDFAKTASDMPRLFPRTMKQFLSFEQSRSRYQSANKGGTVEKASRNVASSVRQALRKIRRPIKNGFKSLRASISSTPVERLLKSYGLLEQARFLKATRVKHVSRCSKLRLMPLNEPGSRSDQESRKAA